MGAPLTGGQAQAIVEAHGSAGDIIDALGFTRANNQDRSSIDWIGRPGKPRNFKVSFPSEIVADLYSGGNDIVTWYSPSSLVVAFRYADSYFPTPTIITRPGHTHDTSWDTAELTGTRPGVDPTGTVTYSLFPDNTCTAPAISTQTVAVLPHGLVPNSNRYGALSSGQYSFQATYSGDVNYNSSTSTCEPFAPTVRTGVVVKGLTAYVTARVTGTTPGLTPTGTVTYRLFPNRDCTAPATDTQTVVLDTAGMAPSSNRHTLPPGEYAFQASYSGDDHYREATGSCEPFPPTVFTGRVISGSTVYATATVAGTTPGRTPTGTVTYRLFPNRNCTAPAKDTQPPVTLDPAGKVPSSKPYTLPPGEYAFQAAYSGDPNELPSTSTCAPFTI